MDCGKLIELLNEYDEGRNWKKLHWKGLGCEDHDTIGYKDKELSCEQDEIIAYLISKKYGFIKWLVDNDKIVDFVDKKETLVSLRKWSTSPLGYVEIVTPKYEQLLMLLAIQDEPIDFLIESLK